MIRHTLRYATNWIRSLGKSNEDVFNEVYRRRLWGSNPDSSASSGSGSLPDNTEGYEQFVAEYITRYGIRSIVDVGCGDFQVAQRILGRVPEAQVSYLGVDVSSVLIDELQKRHAGDNVAFRQMDASVEDLPAADLVTIREVLQHLNNETISAVLSRLRDRQRHSHVLVTNTVAREPVDYNRDIPTGSNARAGLGSGVWLEEPPFNTPCSVVYTQPHTRFETILRTVELG